MTAFDAVLSRIGTFDANAIHQFREDHAIGGFVHEVDDVPIMFQPLTSCEYPQEIGCVNKLFEESGVAKLVARKKRKGGISGHSARKIRKRLDLSKIARRMEQKAQDLKGPVRVCRVKKISIPGPENSIRTVLAVVFTHQEGRGSYGYFFHLKVGLMLCGFKAKLLS